MNADTHTPEAGCLKVSSKSSPASVAGAIAGMVKDGVGVEIQAVGAGAVNQAVKAIALSRLPTSSSMVNIARQSVSLSIPVTPMAPPSPMLQWETWLNSLHNRSLPYEWNTTVCKLPL